MSLRTDPLDAHMLARPSLIGTRELRAQHPRHEDHRHNGFFFCDVFRQVYAPVDDPAADAGSSRRRSSRRGSSRVLPGDRRASEYADEEQ